MQDRTFANAVIPIPQSRERNLALRWTGAQGRLAGVGRRRNQSEIPRGVYPERTAEILLPRLRDQNDRRRARNDTGKGREEP
jgi:hypothetical protein